MARYYYHRIDHPNGPEYENYLAHEQWVMYGGLIHDQDVIDLTNTSPCGSENYIPNPVQNHTSQI